MEVVILRVCRGWAAAVTWGHSSSYRNRKPQGEQVRNWEGIYYDEAKTTKATVVQAEAQEDGQGQGHYIIRKAWLWPENTSVVCPVMADSVTLWPVACQASLSVGILQARIWAWIALSSSRGSSQPRDRTQVSCISPLKTDSLSLSHQESWQH